eukprot:TRINITY_DN5472_c0_g1_i1.p1 TRINITY_DN5472_c0_g1~~TRINITY_DN5472_c0_g1_i1.p1  ORF type:complete len:148 (+),score=14.89 TRINITY_DN5472_c0_g1_i1:291-734(+)
MTDNTVGRRPLRHGEVDREKICPFLLRVFYKMSAHNRAELFDRRGDEPSDEIQIYTWKDATLREITTLLQQVVSAANSKNARLSFAVVYPDKIGRMVLKEIGTCWSAPSVAASRTRRTTAEITKDDNKTLDELRFETGDYLDVAIYP